MLLFVFYLRYLASLALTLPFVIYVCSRFYAMCVHACVHEGLVHAFITNIARRENEASAMHCNKPCLARSGIEASISVHLTRQNNICCALLAHHIMCV